MEEERKEIIKEEKKSSGGLVAFMILLLLAILGFSSYFIYQQINKPDNNGEDLIDEDEKELIYKLDVYGSDYATLCIEKSDYCKNVALTIPTKTENTRVLGFDDNYQFILFKDDNELKIYNKKTNESQGILLEDTYKEYYLFANELKDNIAGIVYKTNDNKTGYFNVVTGKKLYEGKYDSSDENVYVSLIQINDNYLSVSLSTPKAYLLSAKEEKEILEYEEDGPSFAFVSYGLAGNYTFALKSCAGDCVVEKIYSNDLKEIYNKKIYEQNISSKNNIVYFSVDNKVNKLESNGSITEYKTFSDVKGLIEDNVVFVESEKIKYENISSGKVTEVGEFKNNYYYDIYTSGYYTREKLDKLGEKDKEAGMYIVINYSEKDSNGNYGIEYCYTESGSVKTYAIEQEIGGRAKPVLYLYPKETTNVKISFMNPEYLTTTYPKYNNGWNVVANPNGDLYDKEGKYYYGLYWDEVRYNEVDFHEGFYVEKDNAIEFLEEKLDIIGLNNHERNEFIMYWLPIIESNQKNLVYFELTKERELGNKLIIEPKPDSLLRLSIHIKKVNSKVDIKEQKLEHFERNGFSVVEWGGMTY